MHGKKNDAGYDTIRYVSHMCRALEIHSC